jgi:hypothetical protein
MLHPDFVCGVSAHSGGTWATDNYGEITKAAKKIPFAISCGEKDVGLSFPESPFGRLDWYKRFAAELDDKGFCYIGGIWPNVGHSISGGAWDYAKQCFQLSTGLPGQSATEAVTISPEWKNLDNLPRKASIAKSVQQQQAPPVVSEAELDGIVRAAFRKADAETVSDPQLVGFMKKYPPVLWKDKPGSEKLLAQCKGAAGRWHAAAKQKEMLTPELKKEFSRFSEGLDMTERH